MTEIEIQSLKDLHYDSFVQIILTQLVFLAKDHEALDELILHSRTVGISDELDEALRSIRDEKIVSILKNEH